MPSLTNNFFRDAAITNTLMGLIESSTLLTGYGAVGNYIKLAGATILALIPDRFLLDYDDNDDRNDNDRLIRGITRTIGCGMGTAANILLTEVLRNYIDPLSATMSATAFLAVSAGALSYMTQDNRQDAAPAHLRAG